MLYEIYICGWDGGERGLKQGEQAYQLEQALEFVERGRQSPLRNTVTEEYYVLLPVKGWDAV